MTIHSFSGPYEFLSNFYKAEVVMGGGMLVFPTAEHAFQSYKTDDYRDILKFTDCNLTAAQAKRLGRSVTLRPNWENVKDACMLSVLRLKFCPGSELARKLMDTGDAELVEGNNWGDTYWGVCNGVGQNKLGELLMQVRDELNQGR